MEEENIKKPEKRVLTYDKNLWKEVFSTPVNTLQLFITNKCNLKCRGCFYSHKIGSDEISLEKYKDLVEEYKDQIQKIILLGGEPTLHPDLEEMLNFNQKNEIKTTIYTNGLKLSRLNNFDLTNVQLRIGVYGSTSSEKPISKIEKTKQEVTIVYMLRKDNLSELIETAKIAENDFNCKGFYISSIKDIAKTNNFWIDTPETISPEEYFEVVQKFVDNYRGKILVLHISNRGIIKTEDSNKTYSCRFGNIFPDGEKIICPFDISRKITTDNLIFNKRYCNKDNSCLLQKTVLKRRL